MILVRELGVTALRFWVIRYGVIPASRGGKVKTALQILAIAWYLWPLPESLAAGRPMDHGRGAGGHGRDRPGLRAPGAAAAPVGGASA